MNAFRTILARFSARCNRCNGDMPKGARIRWAKGLGAHHTACTLASRVGAVAAPKRGRVAQGGQWRNLKAVKHAAPCGRCHQVIAVGERARWLPGTGIWHVGADCGQSVLPASFTLPDGTVIDDTNYTNHTTDLLGRGISRKVYALGTGHVLKVNIGGNQGAGDCTSEADMWRKVDGTPDAGLFAKVFALSNNGVWLIAERVGGVGVFAPASLSKRLHAKYGLIDLHAGNVRRLANGAIKIIDYAFIRR